MIKLIDEVFPEDSVEKRKLMKSLEEKPQPMSKTAKRTDFKKFINMQKKEATIAKAEEEAVEIIIVAKPPPIAMTESAAHAEVAME